jgi:hypothetical protein
MRQRRWGWRPNSGENDTSVPLKGADHGLCAIGTGNRPRNPTPLPDHRPLGRIGRFCPDPGAQAPDPQPKARPRGGCQAAPARPQTRESASRCLILRRGSRYPQPRWISPTKARGRRRPESRMGPGSRSPTPRSRHGAGRAARACSVRTGVAGTTTPLPSHQTRRPAPRLDRKLERLSATDRCGLGASVAQLGGIRREQIRLRQ